jgi:hypothetical protein
MKKHIMAALSLSFLVANSAQAVDFDPSQFTVTPKRAPEIESFCLYSRDAVEGKSKVWNCKDGTQRFGPTNVFGVVLPAQEPNAHDQRISMSKIVLELKVTADLEACAKSGVNCELQRTPVFSYVTFQYSAECEYNAPRFAYRQYKGWAASGIPAKVSWECLRSGD